MNVRANASLYWRPVPPRGTVWLVRAVLCAALLGGASACDILAALAGGEGMECTSAAACPLGSACVDGRCVAGAPPDARTGDAQLDAGPRPDVLLPDASATDVPTADGTAPDLPTQEAAPADVARDDSGAEEDSGPPRCGSAALLVEHFDGDGINSYWEACYQAGPVVLTEEGGRLSMLFPAGPVDPSADFYGACDSVYATDLRDSAVAMEVAQPVEAGSGVYANLMFSAIDWSATVDFWTADELLETSSGASVPYDRDAHRFWRFRERRGTLFYETSPDGRSWSVLSQEPTPSFLGFGYLEIVAHASERVAFPTLFGVDGFNTTGPGTTWCPAPSFSDDFSGAAPDPLWQVHGSQGCQASQEEGQLWLDVASATAFHCSAHLRPLYDLSEQAVSVRVESWPDHGAFTGIEVEEPTGGYGGIGYRLRFGVSASRLLVRLWQDEQESELFNAALGNRRWLKIDHHGDFYTLSAAVDGASWLPVGAVQASDPTRARVGLFLVEQGTGGDAQTAPRASFAAYNLLP